MASIFDIFTDPLGYKSINKQRRAADAFAREMYDPNVLNPQLEAMRMIASEGIVDDPLRKSVIARTLATSQQKNIASGFGGNQAAYIAGMGAQNQATQRAIAGAEYDIALQEEQAKQKGALGVAEILTQAKQLKATQDASIQENKMLAEANKQARMDKLIGGAIGLGLSAVGGGAGIAGMFKSGFSGLKGLFADNAEQVIAKETMDLVTPKTELAALTASTSKLKQDFYGMAGLPTAPTTSTPITEDIDNVTFDGNMEQVNRMDFFPYSVLSELEDPEAYDKLIEQKFDTLSDEELRTFDWKKFIEDSKQIQFSPAPQGVYDEKINLGFSIVNTSELGRQWDNTRIGTVLNKTGRGISDFFEWWSSPIRSIFETQQGSYGSAN